MVVVSTRDFRANQTKYLNMARRGEQVMLHSRRSGRFMLKPMLQEEEEVISPELLATIELAKLQEQEGKFVECKTSEEVKAYLDSL